MAAPYPAEQNMNRTISQPHYTMVLNFNDIKFLMILKNIGKFERLNNMSINIYGIEEQKILPIWFTDDKKKKQSIVRARFAR